MNFVRDLFLRRKKTHAEISNILKQKYPGEKGFSERTVRRFCLNNNHYQLQFDENAIKSSLKTHGPFFHGHENGESVFHGP